MQEDRQRFNTAQLMGRQRAALAAQGGDELGLRPRHLGDTAPASDAQTIHITPCCRLTATNRGQRRGWGQPPLPANAANTMENPPYGGSSLPGGASSCPGQPAI